MKFESVLFQVRDTSWQLPEAKIIEIRPKKFNTAVLIPILNEANRIRDQLRNMKDAANSVDIIICDGGSVDGCCDPSAFESLGVKSIIFKSGQERMSAQLR